MLVLLIEVDANHKSASTNQTINFVSNLQYYQIILFRYMEPKPEISVFREVSFGHGQLEVLNATHAVWTWHRNDDDVSVVADTVWFRSLSSDPACKV